MPDFETALRQAIDAAPTSDVAKALEEFLPHASANLGGPSSPYPTPSPSPSPTPTPTPKLG